MLTTPEVKPDATKSTRRVHIFLVVSLIGFLMIAVGLTIDFLLHANNPALAAEEGVFSFRNPGHVFLGLGIVATAVGLARLASLSIATSDSESGLLRTGRTFFRVGIVVLTVALAYVAIGPGFGHGGHPTGLPDDLAVFDGSDRSRLPPDQALALATLAWTRPGSLDGEARIVHAEMESVETEQSPGSEKAFADQMAIAVAAVPRLDTIAEVEAQGYVQASNVSDGSGAHWVKWTLVDKPFDPENPSMLLFDSLTRGEPMELIAYSYWVASDGPPEGFSGNTDEWHPHVGMCFENGWLKDDNLPDRRACPGDWVNGSDLWMLHAWIVPGVENVYGDFAVVNPLLCERACGLED